MAKAAKQVNTTTKATATSIGSLPWIALVVSIISGFFIPATLFMGLALGFSYDTPRQDPNFIQSALNYVALALFMVQMYFSWILLVVGFGAAVFGLVKKNRKASSISLILSGIITMIFAIAFFVGLFSIPDSL